MGPQKKVGFELELGSNTSLQTLRRKMSRDLGLERISVHEDYSVDTNKLYEGEFVTPVWNYAEGIRNLRRMFKWMRKNDVITNETTGLHVNISYKNQDLNKAIDPSAVLLMTDDIKWLTYFNRMGGEYCDTPKAQISESIKILARRRKTTINDLKSYIYQRCIVELLECESVDESDLGPGHFFDKYFSINLLPLANKKPYIEYRFIGGVHYHCECMEKAVFDAIDHIAVTLDKSISNKYEAVKTKYVKNMLSPVQKRRIKNK